MTDTEARARRAIALLREGLREFDFQRLAKLPASWSGAECSSPVTESNGPRRWAS